MLGQNCDIKNKEDAKVCETYDTFHYTLEKPTHDLRMIGFSKQINHPEFKRLAGRRTVMPLIIAGIVFLAIFLSLQILPFFLGNFTHQMTLTLGIFVGILAIFGGLILCLKRVMMKTWEGIVADKRIIKKTSADPEGGRRIHYINKIQFDLPDGKHKKMKKKLP